MFNLLIRHDNAGLDNQYQNLQLPAISCFWQCSVSEAIALALLLSHAADDGSFQEDELNSTIRRKKGSKYLERATVKVHLGYFKMMLYQYMQRCPGTWSWTKNSVGSRSRSPPAPWQKAHSRTAPASLFSQLQRAMGTRVGISSSVIHHLVPTAAGAHLPDSPWGATALHGGPGGQWHPQEPTPPSCKSPSLQPTPGGEQVSLPHGTSPSGCPCSPTPCPAGSWDTSRSRWHTERDPPMPSLCLFTGHKMVLFYLPSAQSGGLGKIHKLPWTHMVLVSIFVLENQTTRK